MPAVTAVDVHAHHLGADLPADAGLASAPRLVVDDDGSGRIVRDGATFRRVTSALWTVADRLAEMDRAGVSHQVVSPVPVTMEHAWDADPAYARAVNDSIVAACSGSGGRLLGLGCLPFTTPAAATTEVDRCLGLGLRGIEIGTRAGTLDLDAPELDPVWGRCAETGACVLVHPVDEGRGVVRRPGQPFDLGLGMLTDTALAASSLVFGGVLERHPALRVVLAHGCGAFPWAYPRLRMAAQRDPGGDPAVWDRLVGRLYADSLVFDDEHLRLLVHRFGAERVVLGSDMPFFPGQLAASVRSVAAAEASGALPGGRELLARNATELLGLGGISDAGTPPPAR